jgi:putative ABC transport system substrate-binding protein
MRHRELIAAFSAAVASMSFVAEAAGKPVRVGIASLINPRAAPQFVAFEQRFRQLEEAAGREPAIDFLLLDGHAERYAAAMTNLVARQVDVILAPGQEIALKAARSATRTIPIVIVAIDYDPVSLGYVQSLARPGGNITGVYLNTIELAAKRVQLLKQAVPEAGRFIVLWDAIGADQLKAMISAAQQLGLSVRPVELRGASYDYEAAFGTATPGPGDALICTQSPFFFHDRQQLDELAIRYRLPMMSGAVNSGGLIAYAPSLNAMFRTAAEYVDEIGKGANPADLPIEQPTRFELVISLKMAKALGLSVPPALLARADRVIE